MKTRGWRTGMRAFYAARGGKASRVRGLSTRRASVIREARAASRRQCALVARNPEPQPVRSVGEGPGEDSRREQPLEMRRARPLSRRGGRGASRRGRASRPPLRSASRRAASAPRRSRIASVQARSASAFVPIAIAGPLTGHSAQRRPQRLDDVGRGDGKAEPKAREAKGLAERAQHDRARGQDRRQAFARAVEIGEGFVDDQEPAAPPRAAPASSSRSARGVIRPSGLLGLTTMATWKSPMSSIRFASSTCAPAAAKAAARPP